MSCDTTHSKGGEHFNVRSHELDDQPGFEFIARNQADSDEWNKIQL